MRDLLYPLEPAPLYPRPSIERPGNPSIPRGEMIPLIEPSGMVIGQAKRSWFHEGSRALHPVVHLHLIDRFGRIYLQKRSEQKDLLPGYWDTAVGGHISYGEHPEEALYREAAEELGLHAFLPVLLDSYLFENEREREWVFVYAVTGHPDLAPDNAEVSEGKWWTQEELDAVWNQNVLTPQFKSEFLRIRERLLALL